MTIIPITRWKLHRIYGQFNSISKFTAHNYYIICILMNKDNDYFLLRLLPSALQYVALVTAAHVLHKM